MGIRCLFLTTPPSKKFNGGGKSLIRFPTAYQQFWGFKILKFFVEDPDSGSSAFLTLDPGTGLKNQGDKKYLYINLMEEEIPRSYFRQLSNIFGGFKILKFFVADPDSGSTAFLTLDPGWKNHGDSTVNTGI